MDNPLENRYAAMPSSEEVAEYYGSLPLAEEVPFHEYLYERWVDDPKTWSPLITLEQLEQRPDLEVDWYATDWIPVGAKVLLAAEPKCGKTILLFHILNSILHGKPFLGKKSTPAKVIYLTEQTEHEFKRQIKEVPGLAGNPNFYVLLAEEFPTDLSSWRRLLQFVEEKMVITGAKIVVFDTFLGMAKLPPDGENDSATIQNCINESNFLFKNRYLSVVFVHHNRKRSDDPKMRYASENIQSIRGSSAFAGGVGHIIEMSAPNMNDTARKFNFYGRYIHGEQMTLTLINSQYHLNSYARA